MHNYGMIATGNQVIKDSLRGAPPSPIYPTRRTASRCAKMFRFLHTYSSKTSKLFLCRHPKIGTFSGVGWRCARRGFLRGHAFSECPLKSPSFGTFLGDQEKYIAL